MDFTKWYNDLKSEADLEPWLISLDSTPDFTYKPQEWVEFLNSAFKIRQERTSKNVVFTSYAWHDEQASQLRFATSQCDIDSLPFSCQVELVDSPISFISAWLKSSSEIPFDELSELNGDDFDDPEKFVLQVWAIRHSIAQ